MTREEIKAIISKSCEWLEQNLGYDEEDELVVIAKYYHDIEELIDDFRQEMEDYLCSH